MMDEPLNPSSPATDSDCGAIGGPGACPWRGSRGKPLGTTLVELLVVLLISVIVVAVAFTLYRVNVTYYVKEDAGLEQAQNLRVALHTIARDVRMAGNSLVLIGLNPKGRIQAWTPGREVLEGSPPRAVRKSGPGWFAHADIDPATAPGETGVRAIFGVDGGQDGPDTLTIFRAEVETGAPLGQLSQPYPGAGANRLNLIENFKEGTLRNRDLIVLVNNSEAALLEVDNGDPDSPAGEELPPSAYPHYVPVKVGGRFSPPAGQARSFPVGAGIYNLRDVVFVTYYVQNNAGRNDLMADYHDLGLDDPDNADPGTVVIASHVDDFQVYYYFEADPIDSAQVGLTPDISSNILKNHRVKAVSLGLISRSAREDRAGGARYQRPAFFNRRSGADAGEAKDRFPRQTMTETIYLRNF